MKVGAEKSGRIIKVLHDVGDRVKPGEPLVELEAINADLAIRQAEQRLISELAKLGLKELPGADFDVARLPAVVQAQVAVDRAEEKFARSNGSRKRRSTQSNRISDANSIAARRRPRSITPFSLPARRLASAMASQVELEVARQAREDLIVYAPRAVEAAGKSR